MAARCRRFPATAAEGKRGDVVASHRGLGQAVGLTRILQTVFHPSTQAIQTAAAAAQQWVRVEENCTL